MAIIGNWIEETDYSIYEWFDNYHGQKVKQQIFLDLCSTNSERARFKSSFLLISPLEILNLNAYYFDRQIAIKEIESWATFISETIHLDYKQKKAVEEDRESNIYFTTLIRSECLWLETKLPSGVIESHFQEIYSFDVEIHDKYLDLDVTDIFPRYYIDKSVAKLDMLEWSKRWLSNYAQISTEYANKNLAELLQGEVLGIVSTDSLNRKKRIGVD